MIQIFAFVRIKVEMPRTVIAFHSLATFPLLLFKIPVTVPLQYLTVKRAKLPALTIFISPSLSQTLASITTNTQLVHHPPEPPAAIVMEGTSVEGFDGNWWGQLSLGFGFGGFGCGRR